MPLRGPPDGRYGGAESPGQPSRERVDPGKADTAPKAAPGFRAGLSCLSASGGPRRGAVVLIGGATPGTPGSPGRHRPAFGAGADAIPSFPAVTGRLGAGSSCSPAPLA